jgi:phage terminase small subunit
MERPLNYKQERFVTEFLMDHNARQAAIRAGSSARS